MQSSPQQSFAIPVHHPSLSWSRYRCRINTLSQVGKGLRQVAALLCLNVVHNVQLAAKRGHRRPSIDGKEPSLNRAWITGNDETHQAIIAECRDLVP